MNFSAAMLLAPLPRTMSRENDQVSMNELLDEIQAELVRFVGSLVANPSDVDDVVQEVNLTVWNKREQFEPGSNFRAWVFSIARFKVLALYRDAVRSRLEYFGGSVGEEIENEMIALIQQTDDRREALRQCLERLSPIQVELLEARYSNATSLVDLAKSKGISASAAHKAISRLRTQLRNCVNERLKEEDSK